MLVQETMTELLSSMELTGRIRDDFDFASHTHENYNTEFKYTRVVNGRKLEVTHTGEPVKWPSQGDKIFWIYYYIVKVDDKKWYISPPFTEISECLEATKYNCYSYADQLGADVDVNILLKLKKIQ